MATEPTLTFPAGDWRNIFDPKRLNEGPVVITLPPKPKVPPLSFIQFTSMWQMVHPELSAVILPLGYVTDPAQLIAHSEAVQKFLTDWRMYSDANPTG